MSKTNSSNTHGQFVYEEIKKAIISQEYLPNQQIVETVAAQKYGVGRALIRESLRLLSHEGLINIVPNKGAYVYNPSVQEIKEVFNCKRVLEVQAIREACASITDGHIRQLLELIEQEKITHQTKDFYEFIKVNHQFHVTIAEATNNRYYEKFIGELTTKSNGYLIFYDNFRITEMEDSNALKEHMAIVEALKSRNEQACVEAMLKHTDNTINSLNLPGK